MADKIQTTRVDRTVSIIPGAPEEVNIDSDSTVYRNAPVTGGTTEVIINDIVIRSPVRTKQDILSWRTALQAAESRYYPNRTTLYDIYTDVNLDGHLTGLIEKRITAVLNHELYFSDDKGVEIEEMNDFIHSITFQRIMREIMKTQLWGITGMEFIPGDLCEMRIIPRKHIDAKNQVITIEQSVKGVGFDYTKLNNVWVIGEQEDLGLLLQCCPYVLYKRGAMADWANFIEIFGQPVRVAKYDPFDRTTEAALKKTLDASGSLLALLIPKTAEFEIIDGKTSNANGDLQDTYIKALNQELSVIIVGNTETTSNSGTGSQAKSKTHAQQQREITKADLAYTAAMLNDPHFLRILKSYGLPVKDGTKFGFKAEIDLESLTQRVIIDTTLVGAGLRIAEDYFYETYNIPKPGPGDVLVESLPVPQPGTPPGTPPKKGTPQQQVTSEKQIKDIIKAELKSFFD